MLSPTRGGPIIWPLRGKLFHPGMEQNPKSNSNLLAPSKVINLPWNAQGTRVKTADAPPPFPTVVHQLLTQPAYDFRIVGITRDSTGAVLGSCVVKLYRTSDDTLLQTTTSDAVTGAYEFRGTSPVLTQYGVSYKTGSPDVAGTTVNTLVGA